MFTTDPHHNEYLAAVAGMADHTAAPVEPAVGDFISGTTSGKAWSGRVEWIDGHLVAIDVGGGWLRVPLKDITH
jgi:hypothetical protein